MNPYKQGDILTLDGKRVKVISRTQNSCQVKTEQGLRWVDWKEFEGSLRCVWRDDHLSNLFSQDGVYVPIREMDLKTKKISYRLNSFLLTIDNCGFAIISGNKIYARFWEVKK